MSSGRERWWIGALLAVTAAGCGGTNDAPSAGSGSSASPASGSAGSGSGAAVKLGSAAAVSEAPLPGASGRTTIESPPKVIVMDEPKLDLPKQESFRLLDPGTGARAVLRYARATAPWTITSTLELTTRHLEQGTWTAPTAIPKIGVGMTITPDATRPHRFQLRFLPAQLAAPSPDAEHHTASWHRLLEGRLATLAIDDRGQLSNLSFNDDPTGARSASARDELFAQLLSAVLPLPVEPVGVHASWRVVTILRLGPFYGKQTATYTLTERSATSWKVHVKLQQVAEQQRVNDPALPAGTALDLLALFRNLEVDAEIDRARPVGGNSNASLEYRMHVQVTRPGAGSAATTERMFEDLGTAISTTTP